MHDMQVKALTNAESLTGRLFTKEEHAQNHCQITMDVKGALDAVRLMQPRMVLPVHYNCAFLGQRNINPTDDEMFNREVEKMGIECSIMKYGDEIII